MRNDQKNDTAVWENIQEQFEKVSCRMRLSIGDRKHVAPILSARSVLEGGKLIGRRRNRRHLHHHRHHHRRQGTKIKRVSHFSKVGF